MADQRGGEVRDEKDLKLGGGGETINANEDAEEHDSSGETIAGLGADQKVNEFNGRVTIHDQDGGIVIILPICSNLEKYFCASSSCSLGTNENVENHDFGRDTNRIRLFSVTPFNVCWDDDLNGIASYGGGSSTPKESTAIAGTGATEGSSCGDREGVRLLRWWKKLLRWWKKCWRRLTRKKCKGCNWRRYWYSPLN